MIAWGGRIRRRERAGSAVLLRAPCCLPPQEEDAGALQLLGGGVSYKTQNALY